MKSYIHKRVFTYAAVAACLGLSNVLTLEAVAAPIKSLTVTGGEFRMGVFTPLGPVQFTYTAPYNLITDFPTPIGWDVNVGQNTQNGVTPDPTSVVSFPFGDPLVNTFLVVCDPQVVDQCDVNPHTAPTGTVGGGSPTIADGDSIIVDMNALYANWNGINFNQGGTSGDGVAYPGESFELVYTSKVSNVVGNTFDYDMTWQSLIVGGPFNGQIGTWTFVGSGEVEAIGNLPKTDAGLTLSSNNFSKIAGVTTGDLAAASLPLPGADQDCIGGCWDFLVSGLAAAGDSVNVVIPLGSGIPAPATADQSVELWKLDIGTGIWEAFDQSGGDEIRTASAVATVCPDPGAAAYTVGLTPGRSCIQLTIVDGGPNDNDGVANQQVTDPGGIVLITSAPELTEISENDGCTIAASPKSPWERAEWALIGIFLLLLRLRIAGHRKRDID